MTSEQDPAESEDESTADSENESGKVSDAEDRVETLRQAVNAQQDALMAQQKAVASATDAYVESQDVAKHEKEAAKEAQEARDRRAGNSRRNFLKIGGSVVLGAAVGVVIGASEASVITLPLASSRISGLGKQANAEINAANQTITSLQAQLNTANAEVTTLQTEITSSSGFVILNPDEWALVEAIGETFIPSDSNGPGFKEAGGVYFIDRQLAGEYGTNGNMYMGGPFITPGTAGPITVGSVTYPGGSAAVRLGAGGRFQYPLRMREYWKIGMAAIESYSNSSYGGNFETLSAADQLQVLADLYNNVPSNFSFTIPGFSTGTTVTQTLQIIPQDFFYDLWMMCWCGFLMDPSYGGNQNMVGWTYTGFNGVNMGNFYGEGQTTQQLMVATTPTRLGPTSLGQFQQQAFGSPGGVNSASSSTPGTSSSSSSSSASSSNSFSSSSSTSSSGSA
jgi:gluconate 2-dehydrogenase gamma chain